MSKVIGIVGSRRRDSLKDFHKVSRAFYGIYEEGDTLVSGGCHQGGDRFAELIAIDLLLPHVYEESHLLSLHWHTRLHLLRDQSLITLYHAEWDRFGRRAGFHRNTFIAHDSNVLIACVAKDRTGGTEDTIRKFLAMGEDREGDLILV